MRRWPASSALTAFACGAALAGEAPPTFYRNVLPILQAHCQTCHRPGEIAPMAFVSYRETRPWARAIREAVLSRKMPPWFADPAHGRFANDPSLSREELNIIAAWVNAGAPAGDPRDAPPARTWPTGWNIGTPGAVFEMPQALAIPASGMVEYQYVILPLGNAEDRWVERVEVRPGDASLVHHAVIYAREPGSPWLAGRRAGVPFTLPPGPDRVPDPRSFTTSDILMVYTPGHGFDAWPSGMAKKIKAGSDIVLQIHYTPNGKAGQDRTRVGLVYAASPPRQEVLTLQMGNDRFRIPPGEKNYRVQVSGTLPHDALLVSLFPHMHLRGSAFEYLLTAPGGGFETLLKVDRFNFHWQLNYRLAEPRLLRAGARLTFAGYFDNSVNNPANPDPSAEVRFGEQSWEEMMIGFFDVAVPAGMDKREFFLSRTP